MLDGEELARARRAGLDFIGDQHNTVLVAKLAQAFQEFRRRDVKTALPLHRFDDDRRHPLGFHIDFEQSLQRPQ